MKIMKIIFFGLITLIILPLMASAEVEKQLIRRVVVFPILSEPIYTNEVTEAWWLIREKFTEGKLFLVASKNFLERRDVFQARGQLKPADAIILSELLDAQMIVTGELKDRTFSLYAYESQGGQVIWQETSKMHPSIPVKDQIEKVSLNLTKNLMAAIPYQGFIYKDNLAEDLIVRKDGKVLVQAAFSINTDLEPGDEVQLVKLYSVNQKPLLQGGAHVEIFAEGKVISFKEGTATLEVQRITKLDDIKNLSLVRIPKEMKRLKELYALKDSIKRRINPEYFSPDISEVKQEAKETKPLVTALAFLANIATILLLAF